MNRDMNDRTCIVTRTEAERDRLIRFVAGPDGTVVPDLKCELPGRGCWVTAERAMVDKAAKKNLFSKALRDGVKPPADLGSLVDRLMARELAGMMNMARKAGQFLSGTMKVDNAVRSGEAIAVFHAEEAAPDGVRKIDQARKARALGLDEEEIPSFRPFSAAEMMDLMGPNAFIHAAALAGQAGEGVVKRANRLMQYRRNGTVTTTRGDGGPERP